MLEPANKHYPYAQMTILFGLFLVIFIEQFVGFIQKTQKGELLCKSLPA